MRSFPLTWTQTSNPRARCLFGAELAEYQEGSNFEGFNLELVTRDNMFELHNLQGARLWMLPTATMEVVMELLCKDWLAHSQWPVDDTFLEEGSDEEC